MNIQKFLDRIGFEDEIDISLKCLTELQNCCLRSIPFENLDMHRGIKLDYSPGPVYEKIVEHRRGGVCFECNGLFYDVLTTIGYKVDMLSAKMLSDGGPPDSYTHTALIVHLEDESYLVDVGNGIAIGPPLPIKNPVEAPGERGDYRVGPFEDMMALYFRAPNENWAVRYKFTLTPQPRNGFDVPCRFIQTSPTSMFVQKRLASRLTETGRVTLTNMTFIETTATNRIERELASETEYTQTLAKYFNIQL